MGHGQESEESEEEHDVWRTYSEIYDNNFDYDEHLGLGLPIKSTYNQHIIIGDTPRSHRHWFCIVAILCSRSLTQAGPWIIATQPALNVLPRRVLVFSFYVAASARPPPSLACAPCSHPQTGLPDSATSPVIVLY